ISASSVSSASMSAGVYAPALAAPDAGIVRPHRQLPASLRAPAALRSACGWVGYERGGERVRLGTRRRPGRPDDAQRNQVGTAVVADRDHFVGGIRPGLGLAG